MPTPLGHGLAGIAAGWSVAGPIRGDRRAAFVQSAIFAALGAGADLDLLIGRHSGETHSLGAAAIVAALAAWRRWPIASTRAVIFLAAFAAWATHPLLDSLAPDYSAPFGVMAFWPLSHQYFISGLSVFMPIWRSPGNLKAVTHDVVAVAREIAILLPIVYATWKVKARSWSRVDQALGARH
ncbi:MAG TPA: metal-dependent hydrolase [Vicinamibacterales bacterium]|nr:metal-dependent hydrolase [Vicinamibacterales bacterium]